MTVDRDPERLLTAPPGRDLDTIHPWVLGLPWVVERPTSIGSGIRLFGVDCPPLQRRRMWLVTGLGDDGPDGPGSVAVIVPDGVAHVIERLGWGARSMTMPRGHALVTSTGSVDSDAVLALLLTGYQHAVQ